MGRQESSSSLNRKAYAGDGLLRYALGKIFLFNNYNNKIFLSQLESNKVLAEIVCSNPEIFGDGIKPADSESKIHYLGTIYEARLFDICESEGIEAVVKFVSETFHPLCAEGGILSSYETYIQWRQARNKRLDVKNIYLNGYAVT